MSYATLADLVAYLPRGEQELVQLTDLAGTGEIDQAKVQRVLDKGTTLIDSHVGVRYDLPLPTVPPLLVELNCDLSRYQLYGDIAPDEVATRNKIAMDMLLKIARGEASLNLPPPAQQPGLVVGGEILISGPGRLFSRSRMRGL